MQRTAALLTAAAGFAIAAGTACAADPLPKRGNLSGAFAWSYAPGKNIQVDKDHIVWGGVAAGPFIADGGKGLLHASAAECTFAGEFMKGTVTYNAGACVTTDADGDKVAFNWKCTACPANGEIVLTNGTGKYAGIKGSGTFQQNDAGPFDANMGWSIWKVKWELP